MCIMVGSHWWSCQIHRAFCKVCVRGQVLCVPAHLHLSFSLSPRCSWICVLITRDWRMKMQLSFVSLVSCLNEPLGSLHCFPKFLGNVPVPLPAQRTAQRFALPLWSLGHMPLTGVDKTTVLHMDVYIL